MSHWVNHVGEFSEIVYTHAQYVNYEDCHETTEEGYNLFVCFLK